MDRLAGPSLAAHEYRILVDREIAHVMARQHLADHLADASEAGKDHAALRGRRQRLGPRLVAARFEPPAKAAPDAREARDGDHRDRRDDKPELPDRLGHEPGDDRAGEDHERELAARAEQERALERDRAGKTKGGAERGDDDRLDADQADDAEKDRAGIAGEL